MRAARRAKVGLVCFPKRALDERTRELRLDQFHLAQRRHTLTCVECSHATTPRLECKQVRACREGASNARGKLRASLVCECVRGTARASPLDALAVARVQSVRHLPVVHRRIARTVETLVHAALKPIEDRLADHQVGRALGEQLAPRLVVPAGHRAGAQDRVAHEGVRVAGRAPVGCRDLRIRMMTFHIGEQRRN